MTFDFSRSANELLVNEGGEIKNSIPDWNYSSHVRWCYIIHKRNYTNWSEDTVLLSRLTQKRKVSQLFGLCNFHVKTTEPSLPKALTYLDFKENHNIIYSDKTIFKLL